MDVLIFTSPLCSIMVFTHSQLNSRAHRMSDAHCSFSVQPGQLSEPPNRHRLRTRHILSSEEICFFVMICGGKKKKKKKKKKKNKPPVLWESVISSPNTRTSCCSGRPEDKRCLMCVSAKKWTHRNSLFSAVLLKIICLFCQSGPTQGPEWGSPWSCSGLKSGCAVGQTWLVFSQVTSYAFVTVTWLQYYENIHIDPWLGLPLGDETAKGVKKSSAPTREDDVSHWWWIESVRLARRENGWWWCVEVTGTSRQMAEHKRRAGATFMVPAKSEFWIVVGHDWFSHHGVRKVRLCVKACTAVGESISGSMRNHSFPKFWSWITNVSHTRRVVDAGKRLVLSLLSILVSLVLFLLRSCSQSHLDADKKKKVYF